MNIGSPTEAEDRTRDRIDHPGEVLAFFGVQPGMRALDLNAATGYYSEHLARAVGPSGHVVSHNHPGAVTMLGEVALYLRYRDGRLPNVETLLARHVEVTLPPHSLDFVLMSMVYHDTYWSKAGVDWGPVKQQVLLSSLYQALRPGGAVGVIDHAAPAGESPDTSALARHRIDPGIVRRDFLNAGFVLDAESNLLRAAGDDHTRSVFDPAIKGRTDRFLMRFRRPADYREIR